MAGRAKSEEERLAKVEKHYPGASVDRFVPKPARGGHVDKPARGGPAMGVWEQFTPVDAERARAYRREVAKFRRDAWNEAYAQASAEMGARIVDIEQKLLELATLELESGVPDTKLLGQALSQIRDMKDRLGGKATAQVEVESDKSVNSTIKRFLKDSAG